MKKNIKNFIINLCFVLILFLIFANRLTVASTIIESVNIWLTKIFPTLFIMVIISDFLINYNFSLYLQFLFGKVFNKIFRLSPNGVMAFILSLISGTPANAFIISELYKKNKISLDEANRLIKFTFFLNPLFLYTILMILFDKETTLTIMLSLYLSNILLGLVTTSKNNIGYSNFKGEEKQEEFGILLVNSIKKSMNLIILILGSITFFMILSNIISIYIDNSYVDVLINGILEVTGGLEKLIKLDIFNNIKKYIALILLSFGGLSIHAQIYSIIYDTPISYNTFLKGRFISTMFAILIYIILI